ncbi:MAG: MGMT family protein [Erysipelotrichaceae bacterium]
MLKDEVFQYLKNIPQGKVVTYGQIASDLGNKKLARIVGNIIHGNSDPYLYPCYKVVNRNGQLAQKYAFGGIEKQKELLQKEGIVVTDYRVDLAEYQMK